MSRSNISCLFKAKYCYPTTMLQTKWVCIMWKNALNWIPVTWKKVMSRGLLRCQRKRYVECCLFRAVFQITFHHLDKSAPYLDRIRNTVNWRKHAKFLNIYRKYWDTNFGFFVQIQFIYWLLEYCLGWPHSQILKYIF